LFEGGIIINKNILAIGIICLFIISTISPIAFGYNIRISKENEPEAVSSNGPMDSAWPMFQHDAKHTGRSPYGKEGNWRMMKWRFYTDAFVESPPVIDKNGTIYFGSRYFYALNLDGTLKWQYTTKEAIEHSPAIDENGNIYFGTVIGSPNYFYALYPNGTLKWRYQTGDNVKTSPAIGNDGVIYFGDDNKNIYAFYPNGTLKWEYKTGGLIHTNPAIGDDGTIYCGSADHYMYALFPNNGTVKWKYNAGCRIGGDPTIADDGTIYFGGVESGALYALYPNGTLKWKLTIGVNVISSPALAEDGTIYVAAYKQSWGANIYSINPDGSINWQYEVGGEAVSASPVIDKFGTIYIGEWTSGNFYALNPDGTLKWIYSTGDSIHGSAAIDENGIIYVGSWDDYLYAIEPFDDNFPETPDVDGPLNGKPLTIYTYTATSSDLDGDDISYYFDWGDDTNSGWTEFVSSGTPMSKSHSWILPGSYAVRVGVKDIYDATSWETLYVTIPKNKATFNLLFYRFFEQFPVLERFLTFFIK